MQWYNIQRRSRIPYKLLVLTHEKQMRKKKH